MVYLMNKIALFLFFCSLIFANNESFGQDSKSETSKTSRKEERKEKRALVKKAYMMVDSINFAAAGAAIEHRKWFIEVKTLYDKNGMPVVIDSPRDMISMRGEQAGIHLSFKFDAYNLKGIPKMSANGTVGSYSKSVDKKGEIMLRYLVFGKGRDLEVVVRLLGNGNVAEVEIESAGDGKKLRFSGNLLPLEKGKKF